MKKQAKSPSPPARIKRIPETKRVPRAVKAAKALISSSRGSFPIVGIGASAGGLEALVELFENMPKSTGLGFVVVTHQHPGHPSMLPELLGKVTALRVVEAADGMKVEQNCVYVSPPGGYLAILNGTLHRMETGVMESPHLPIDSFFRSLAKDQREKAVCIILSGTGTDGTLGLRAIKGESGMAMVQLVASAKYAGMPSSALTTGLVDYALPCRDMPAQLVAYAYGAFLTSAHLQEPTDDMPEPLQKILVLLRSRVGHDFSGYKTSTIRRRIERRMNLHQFNRPRDYMRYVQENPEELDTLFKELLISVTNFFRDADAFDVLAKSALPELIKSRPDNYTMRVWVPGCATGEEVFSLAILMREVMESLKKPLDVQIFGTDLDDKAIESGRNGLFPEGIAVDVSPQRLERYFLREDGSYRIRKDIREMVIFAVQNVIKDPPFTKLDLISCRNLLIYLDAVLQKRLLPIFHYALKPGGLLFLGPSETIGSFSHLFEVVDKKWKIYRRRECALGTFPAIEIPAQPVKQEAGARAVPVIMRTSPDVNVAGVVDALLLSRYTPDCVVVNSTGEVLFIHGHTGAYLEPSPGHPRLNVISMAREGLQLELSSALRQAVAGNSEVIREHVRVRTNGDFAYIKLGVSLINTPAAARGLFLVTFQPCPPPVERVRTAVHSDSDNEAERVKELEHELQCTKESLQSTIEELEASNEELKSTNEELQSTNEELQSTNEELETSKEEMQSLNEELTTVNSEMHLKVEDLSRANDDMQNLLNSTEIATLFLDNKLHIKRYTEHARRLINLIATDIGRPVVDLVSSLAYDRLMADCAEVLRTLVFKLGEVRTKDGHWYLMRIMPYRTAENVIDGLVLTFVDINPVKEAEKTLLRMSKVFLDGLDPMILLDLSGKIIDLNDEAARTYGWSRKELLGLSANMLMPGSQHKIYNDRLKRCIAGESVRSVDCLKLTKSGKELRGLMTFSLLTDEQGHPESVGTIAKFVST